MTYRDNAQSFEALTLDLSELRDYLQDIDAQILVVDRIREQYYHRRYELGHILKARYPDVPGRCRTCGLPKVEDIDHDPPECPNPKRGDVKDFQAYFKHQRGLYTKALEGLSTERLVAVGIPTSRAFSHILRDVVRKRLDEVEARHQTLLEQRRKTSRWDFINDDAE